MSAFFLFGYYDANYHAFTPLESPAACSGDDEGLLTGFTGLDFYSNEVYVRKITFEAENDSK